MQSLKEDNNQQQKDKLYSGYNQENIDDIISPQTKSALKKIQPPKKLAQTDGIQKKSEAINRAGKPSTTNVAASRGTAPISKHDLECLARLIHGEARGESYEGKVAVASVVLNRVNSKKFGNTVRDVVFQPGAFTAVSDGQYYLQPDAESYKAAESALRGWDPTGGAIYYWNPAKATSKWIWSRPITKTIGRHVFAH